MNDSLTIILVSLAWPILLTYGIWLTRREVEPWASLAHVASVICLLGPLAAMMRWLDWEFDNIGWWVLAIVPSAVIINLAIIAIAGNLWPHCKQCGAAKVPVNYEVGRGTEDQGYVVVKTCPKCKK